MRVDRDVYRHIPTSAHRVAFLRALDPPFELVADVDDAGALLARALLDMPRRVLRRLGIDAKEPGDREIFGRATHFYFGEEGLLREIAAAGLVVRARRGSVWSLEQGKTPPETPDALAIEVVRVAAAVPTADRRRRGSPSRAVGDARRDGGERGRRGPLGRARLRVAIAWVDGLTLRPSCYRRVLLELALDAGAAEEAIVFGLDVERTGHVAFADRDDRGFDVAFAMPGKPGKPGEAGKVE